MGDEAGFTLVEVLVVMLILGLLAAVAIPAFLNQREKVREADAKAWAHAAATAMETYGTANGGSYNGADPAALNAIEAAIDVARLSVDASGADFYALTVSSSSGNTFSIERLSSGNHTYECLAPGKGGCPAGGDWG